MVGELTPILKALLFVRDDLTGQANQLASTINAKIRSGKIAECAGEIATHTALAAEAFYYGQIFRSALAKEYPELKGMDFGYGPSFEVYMYTSQSSLVFEMLGAGLISSMFGERCASH